ncbi:MAG: rod shape-determining protein MreC [Bacteroidota bacterium]
MERLLRLFYNNGSFFTFCFLQVVCLYLIINRDSPQSEIALETWSVRTGKFKSAISNVNQYVDLRERNEISRRENAKLKSLLPFNRYPTIPDLEEHLDSTSRQRFNYLSTNVVNRKAYSPNNTFVIDRGDIFGVMPGQGVVDNEGLLGIVDITTPNHARVISILHGASRISAGLKDGTFGTLRWNGQDPRRVEVTNIADYIEVQAGDTVYTTGYSNVFPTGQVVGIVESAEVQPGTGLQSLTVKHSKYPLRSRHAYVVVDLFKEELQELQEQ